MPYLYDPGSRAVDESTKGIPHVLEIATIRRLGNQECCVGAGVDGHVLARNRSCIDGGIITYIRHTSSIIMGSTWEGSSSGSNHAPSHVVDE